MIDPIPTLRSILAQHFGLAETSPQLADLPTLSLRADLRADSLDLVELLMATEEAFDIEITDDEATAALGQDGDMPLSGLIALLHHKCTGARHG